MNLEQLNSIDDAHACRDGTQAIIFGVAAVIGNPPINNLG